ncbi:MAG: TlpA disulfide reductase family protein [Steroidobacteraceae bacterium]
MNESGLRLLGAALVVLISAWAGARFYMARSAQEPRGIAVPAGEGSLPNSGDAVSTDPESFAAWPHPEIPARLPAFSLNDLAGKPTPILRWAGKSLVINFWATWCAPCRREIPLLKALAAEWAGRDMMLVGIAVDYPDKVQEFAREFKIDYPLLIGEQDALDVAAQFGMDSPAFPFTVFTDRRGEVVALFVGELHRPQADFILSVVQNLNQDVVQLPEARRRIAEGLAAIRKNRAG